MTNYLQAKTFLPQQIFEPVSPELGIIVVIPCFNEPDLISSLNSLYNCTETKKDVEVIIVVNSSENNSLEIIEQNNKTLSEAAEWIKNNQREKLKFHLIHSPNLPKKHSGVGLARKIGMDEAVRRFELIGNKIGIIVGFDADSLCDKNYLAEIEIHFRNFPKTKAVSIHFEHPVSGNLDPKIYQGIISYELHFRFYNQALRFADFPYAFHTIGSSFAVKSDIYQQQGGMNKRQAGEDFYFLQKIIPLGNYGEIFSTKVIPSPRSSDRVPFGTGRAIGDYLKYGKSELLTYNPKTFSDLKEFFQAIPSLYQIDEYGLKTILSNLPKSVREYLEKIRFETNMDEIQVNSSTLDSFIKRFFRWFNGLQVLKFVHFTRDHFYSNLNVRVAAIELLKLQQIKVEENISERELLAIFRELDKRAGSSKDL